MAATITTLIGTITDRLGWGSADAAKRLIVLDALNKSEKFIAQQGSFLYLSKRSTINLLSATSSVASPADYDYGKAAAIIGDLGPLEFKRLGEFDAVILRTSSTGYSIRNDRPSFWTFAFSAGVATIFFGPANTSGGTIAYTFTYQRTVVDLLDNSVSVSLLPEGYEQTILVDRAEWLIKDKLAAPMSPTFVQSITEGLQQFYGSQRTNKPEAITDPEIAAEMQGG